MADDTKEAKDTYSPFFVFYFQKDEKEYQKPLKVS